MTSICPWYLTVSGYFENAMTLSKSVLNSVTFDNCGRFWKCAKQKIMYGSSSSHTKRKHVLQALTTGLVLLGFLDCKQKKSFPDTECKVRQQFFTDSD